MEEYGYLSENSGAAEDIAMTLNSLEFNSALRKLQQYAGLPVTGRLTNFFLHNFTFVLISVII